MVGQLWKLTSRNDASNYMLVVETICVLAKYASLIKALYSGCTFNQIKIAKKR